MANKFDIDSSADTHLLNETFHVFSKSPGSPTTTLGGARLKSGHTTTATDVWADEIPAFFNAATQAKFDLFQSKAVKDDLCLFDGKVYQHNGTAFVSLGTTDEVLVDGKTFSKNNKAVVKYHKGRIAINLTADNNNGDGSNDYTAKIYNAATGSTTFVPQFISAMDKMVDGIPSLAYDAVVSDSTGDLAEGLTNDNDYICNSYAGVIQFNKDRSQGTVTVSAWEYIGSTLSDTVATKTDITNLENKIVDKTVRINAEGNNITAELTENPNAADSYTISVDGYTTDEIDALLENKADKFISNGNIEFPTAKDTLTGANQGDYSGFVFKLSKDITLQQLECYLSLPAIMTVSGSIYLNIYEYNGDNGNYIASSTNSQFFDHTQKSDNPGTDEKYRKIYNFDNIKLDKNKLYAIRWSVQAQLNDFNSQSQALRVSCYNSTVDGCGLMQIPPTISSSLVPYIRLTSNFAKNLQDVENDLLKHASNEEVDVLHVTQAEKDIINNINNELETYNFSFTQSVETGTVGGTNNTRGFGTLITNDITLGKVITYCHSTGGNENSNIWLKVFERTSAPHIFKGISDTSLNHKHGATLEYTFKNSDIKLEANKEYFFVFCPENQKNSTTFQNTSDSVDCCIQTVSNTTGHGGVCGASDFSNRSIIALHKIYKKPGKFAFANDLEEHTTNDSIHVTQAEKDIWNAGGNALQEIIEGNYIEVDGNKIGVDTTSLVGDAVLTTKINELAAAKANTAVGNHENSATMLHVTQTEKNTWNGKLSSISASSNSGYVGASVNDGNKVVISPNVVTDISVVETGKLIDASTIKTYVDGHTSNNNIHVTIDDKNNWNRNVKNISYLFDKGDGSPIALHGGKTISKYNDGTITYVDDETTNFSVDDATIGIYTFRTASGNANWSSSTPDSLIEFNKREIISKGASPSYGDKPEFYYEYDAFDQNKYDIDYGQTTNSLSNLIVGRGMFTRSGLTIFNDNLSNLQDGFGMFTNSRNLTTFRSALPSLTVGSKMFLGCKKMEIFKTKLPNLSWAECMFRACDSLTTVDTCLPNLTYAQGFFGDCPNLTNITLSPNSCLCLYNADAMFYNCRSLTNLKINLSYLETGNQMFNGCNLNKESLEYIANNIREWPIDDPHPLGVVWYNCTEDEWAVIKKIFEDKGWSVDGFNTNATNLTNETNILYAKVIYGPVYDKYIDSNNNKCDILIATNVKNVDEWKIVSSIEEAAQYYNLQLNTNNN